MSARHGHIALSPDGSCKVHGYGEPPQVVLKGGNLIFGYCWGHAKMTEHVYETLGPIKESEGEEEWE